MSIIQLSYEVNKDDFLRAGEASSHIKKTLRKLGVSSNIIRRASIAAYEAEMNIIIHSEGGTINVMIDANLIEITARDCGPGIENIELAMQEGYSTAPEHIRELGFGAGMGLPNIKRCSDEFVIESKVGEFTELRIKIYH